MRGIRLLIIQAGTPDYVPMMDECRRRCELWGYRYVRHELTADPSDLGGNLPPCTFKPRVLEGLPMTDELKVWLDADAIPVRRIDDPFPLDFDVAVTLREPESVGKSQPITNYLNAGVIFFRGGWVWKFIDDWQDMTAHLGNDQLALNAMVGPGWTDDDWLRSYGKTVTAGSFHVRILATEEWNFSDFNRRPPENARILHFKRGWRQLNGPDWWRSAIAPTN